MPIIRVDAYDERHPAHDELLAVEDRGLDVSLLPDFEMETEVEWCEVQDGDEIVG